MISIDELIKELYSLKQSSEQLSTMFSYGGQNLNNSTAVITNLVRGSVTGQEAAFSLSIASRSLLEASATILTLSRTCDNCISNLSK